MCFNRVKRKEKY